ncbi:MAG: DEAD/DEAH box helicase, partial [Acidobacteria bacterium]|nr:DEAD/DEAH box helicase [Acidobacteriota bacterium]
FKAVMEGKQVAVLTPTTVLSYQHFETFRTRFAAFPVKIELLSRFRSPKEQKEVVKRVESGEIDVLIGTHRVLSKDVRFRDLGLVVVDEEQRFGVAHKERLKQLKKKVDVLTLSATPIPRTLNMSLMGLRDMSLIETPPRDRLAAIREFSDLGAGFRIAALDLELRGAGNLLGGQQSGHMDALGFDLYTQMLERTVAELRGEAVEDETSVSINLGVDVAIPEDYISDMGQRLRAYKRVSSARDEETLRAILAETQDRYGRLPEAVDRLFEYARLRRLAEEVGVVSIDRTPSGVAIKLAERARVSPEKLMDLVGRREGATFTPSGILRVDLDEKEAGNTLETARGVLLEIMAGD